MADECIDYVHWQLAEIRKIKARITRAKKYGKPNISPNQLEKLARGYYKTQRTGRCRRWLEKERQKLADLHNPYEFGDEI